MIARLLVIFALADASLWAQPGVAPPIRYQSADPAGIVCVGATVVLRTTTGVLYTCQGGVLAVIPGGSASSVPFSGVGAGTSTVALVIGNGGSLGATGTGTINATALGGVAAASYATKAAPGFTTITTATNCASGASPAVCAAAPSGAVAIPTGITTVALTVNTTAVTATSRIFVMSDDSLTVPTVTCNNTLATLVGGLAITARTAGASFEVTYNGTIATNPLCVSFLIVN